jgi:hypothetical protein
MGNGVVMTTNRNCIVRVERQDTIEGDLQAHVRIVSNAVSENYRKFDGAEEYHVWPEVVTANQVIVENHVMQKFFRADYSMDEENNVIFTNIVEVIRQYVPVESVERSAFTNVTVNNGTLWDNVL